jgi:hypothetical protein
MGTYVILQCELFNAINSSMLITVSYSLHFTSPTLMWDYVKIQHPPILCKSALPRVDDSTPTTLKDPGRGLKHATVVGRCLQPLAHQVSCCFLARL